MTGDPDIDMPLKKLSKYSYILIAVALNILFFYPAVFSDKTFFSVTYTDGFIQ